MREKSWMTLRQVSLNPVHIPLSARLLFPWWRLLSSPLCFSLSSLVPLSSICLPQCFLPLLFFLQHSHSQRRACPCPWKPTPSFFLSCSLLLPLMFPCFFLSCSLLFSLTFPSFLHLPSFFPSHSHPFNSRRVLFVYLPPTLFFTWDSPETLTCSNRSHQHLDLITIINYS